MKPTLSIIISVFNNDRYLAHCLDGIVKQDCSQVEVILVNDGSKDASGKICDNFVRAYPFIKHLKKKHGGVASARNYGLNHAIGEYVFFLEGKDALSEDAIADVLHMIEQVPTTDCIVGNALRKVAKTGEINERQPLLDEQQINGKSGEEVLTYLFTQVNDVMWEAWHYFFKRDVLVNNQIYFNEDIRIGEDLDFTMRALLVMRNCQVLARPHYIYTEIRKRNRNVKADIDFAKVIQHWLEQASTMENRSLAHAIQGRMVRAIYLDLYPNLFEYDVIDRDKVLDKISLKKEEVQNVLDHRVKITRTLEKVIGTTAMLKLVHTYKYRGRKQ